MLCWLILWNYFSPHSDDDIIIDLNDVTAHTEGNFPSLNKLFQWIFKLFFQNKSLCWWIFLRTCCLCVNNTCNSLFVYEHNTNVRVCCVHLQGEGFLFPGVESASLLARVRWNKVTLRINSRSSEAARGGRRHSNRGEEASVLHNVTINRHATYSTVGVGGVQVSAGSHCTSEWNCLLSTAFTSTFRLS